MKAKLTISERIFALGILNGFKGKLETMKSILDDIQQFSISPEDKKKCQWTENKDKDGVLQSITWDDVAGGEKEIELNNGTADYLLQVIAERNEKGDLTLQDKAAISLKERMTK